MSNWGRFFLHIFVQVGTYPILHFQIVIYYFLYSFLGLFHNLEHLIEINQCPHGCEIP